MCARRLISEVVTVSKMCVVGYSGISGVFLKSILSVKNKICSQMGFNRKME